MAGAEISKRVCRGELGESHRNPKMRGLLYHLPVSHQHFSLAEPEKEIRWQGLLGNVDLRIPVLASQAE